MSEAPERAEALSCEIRGLLDCHHLVTGAAVTRGTLREALEVVDALLAEKERLRLELVRIDGLYQAVKHDLTECEDGRAALARDAADTEKPT